MKVGVPIAVPLPSALVGAAKWTGGILLLRALFGLTLFARPRRRREYVFAVAFVLALVLAPLADAGERLGVLFLGPVFYHRPVDWVFLLLPLPWLLSFRWRERLGARGTVIALLTAFVSIATLALNSSTYLRAEGSSLHIGGNMTVSFGSAPSEILGTRGGFLGLAWQAKDLCEVYALLFILSLLNPLHLSIRRISLRIVGSHLFAGLMPAGLTALFVLLVAALHTANYRAAVANRCIENASRELKDRLADELPLEGSETRFASILGGGAGSVVYREDNLRVAVFGDSLMGCSPDSLLAVREPSSETPLLINGPSVYLRAREDTLIAGRKVVVEALIPVDSLWMTTLSAVVGKPTRLHPHRVFVGDMWTTDVRNPAAGPLGPEESDQHQVPGLYFVGALCWNGSTWENAVVSVTSHAGLGEPFVSLITIGSSGRFLGWLQLSALWLIAVVLIGVVCWIGTMVFGMGRGITRAVGSLTRGTAAIGRGELGYRIPIEGKDEIWSVAGSLNEMAQGLERARDVEREKMRLEKELDIARSVQQNLFPKTLPSATGWDFAAVCRPAREVGGDYYDLFRIGVDEIAFALGDVSGKGLGPSLLMSNVQAMMRTGLRQTPTDVPRIAADLNEHLYSSSSAEMFVTLFIGVLDVATGRLRYVNAGHNPPIIVTGTGTKRASLETGGIIIGAVPGMRFEEGEIVVEPGDIVVVYSDGVTEAMSTTGEQFGEEALDAELLRTAAKGAPEILEGILGSVDRFAAGADQADDISLIVIRRLR